MSKDGFSLKLSDIERQFKREKERLVPVAKSIEELLVHYEVTEYGRPAMGDLRTTKERLTDEIIEKLAQDNVPNHKEGKS